MTSTAVDHRTSGVITNIAPAANPGATSTVFSIIGAISVCHLLNDLMQSLLSALYPMLKQSYGLTYAEIGLLTLTFQATASLLQPFVGIVTDKKPMPFSLPVGMTCTFFGLILLAYAPNFGLLLLAAGMVGMGSSVFHPESSRVARMASGGRLGLAQSLFQVGGNFGTAIGPLAAAYIVLPNGQHSVLWFTAAALAAMIILLRVSVWYSRQQAAARKRSSPPHDLTPTRVKITIGVLAVLIFSKYVYLASMSNYYTFFLMHKFALSMRDAEGLLFVYLGAAAVGTVIGGPIGDRIGRKYVIWGSILGVLPFTLALPYANLTWTVILSVIIGLVIASAFAAIVVFAQELVPGKVGMIAGLFFGLSFGIGGLGAAVLGKVADMEGIDTVYHICSFLPLLGLFTVFLPDMKAAQRRVSVKAG